MDPLRKVQRHLYFQESFLVLVLFLNSGLSLRVTSMDLRGRLAELVFASFEATQAKSNLKRNAHFPLDSKTVFGCRGKFNSMTESGGDPNPPQVPLATNPDLSPPG